MSSNFSATDAAIYERQMGRWSRALGARLIDFAGLGAGERILDLGCGTGSLALELAARPEPALILGIDAAQIYIDFAVARAVDPRISFRTGDACALDLPNHAVDRCFALLVLNFVGQPAQALAEMKRVTRPGGTVAAAVWDFVGGLPYQRMLWDTAAALDPEAARARARHYARPLTWPGELEAAFRDAGLAAVQAGALTIRMAYADFADYWQPLAQAQGPMGDYIRQLDGPRLARLTAAVEAAYLSGRADGPRSLIASAWAAQGRA